MQDVANSRVCNICVYLKTQNEIATSNNSITSGSGSGSSNNSKATADNHNPTAIASGQTDYTAANIIPSIPKVKICRGCHMVAYCNTTHQKLDWPLHREFCRAVQSILKCFAKVHPYEINGEITTLVQLERTILQVKLMLKTKLKRPLRFEEEEWTTFPARCAVCFSFKRLRSCPTCNAVCWCSDSHEQQDKLRHSQECAALRVYYCAFKALPLPAVPVCDLQEPFDLQQMSLLEAFTHKTDTSLPADPADSLISYQRYATAASYSCIGTICYALSYWLQMEPEKAEIKNPFVIFIVGATVEREMWFNSSHTQFFFLHYGKTTELNLYFIGPEVTPAMDTTRTYEYRGCDRKVFCSSYLGTFQQFRHVHDDIEPHFTMLFNCGFSEFVRNSGLPGSWPDGIADLVQIANVPIVFSSFSEAEAKQDYEALLEATILTELYQDVTHLLSIRKNPYADFRALRSPRCTDPEPFYYRNGYIQAIVTRKS